FPNMLEWLVRAGEDFAPPPGPQLLIRGHPAEISRFSPSRPPLLPELGKPPPPPPPNNTFVPPGCGPRNDPPVSVFNSAIIYGTKMGVELTSVGLPVIVAGEAWIRNKGITLDASSPDEYFRLLAQLPIPERLPATQLARARRYAYHFFFNRMIPLPFIEPK